VSFEPKTIVFACNWCAYAGADLAGVSRMQYQANVRIIRTMCSGRLDPGFILRAFEKGADGVMVLGCHPGDCQYIEGNLKAERRIDMTRRLLEAAGMDPDRLWLRWVSASEGGLFVEYVNEFIDAMREKGPNPLAKERFEHVHEVEVKVEEE
jgi:coenzyme F420-reducing hydrogenase delta subunit